MVHFVVPPEVLSIHRKKRSTGKRIVSRMSNPNVYKLWPHSNLSRWRTREEGYHSLGLVRRNSDNWITKRRGILPHNLQVKSTILYFYNHLQALFRIIYWYISTVLISKNQENFLIYKKKKYLAYLTDYIGCLVIFLIIFRCNLCNKFYIYE